MTKIEALSIVRHNALMHALINREAVDADQLREACYIVSEIELELRVSEKLKEETP